MGWRTDVTPWPKVSLLSRPLPKRKICWCSKHNGVENPASTKHAASLSVRGHVLTVKFQIFFKVHSYLDHNYKLRSIYKLRWKNTSLCFNVHTYWYAALRGEACAINGTINCVPWFSLTCASQPSLVFLSHWMLFPAWSLCGRAFRY